MLNPPTKRDSIEYQIGWTTALDIELAAATALLDELHDEPHDFERGQNDHNVYTWGQVSGHNVILASLPEGRYGLISAATVVERLLSSMPHIKLGLLVGIGAGLPESGLDIRLGDVAVSCPEGNTSGVLQYDFGKEKDDGFQRVGMLAPPPDALLHALRKLRANHEIQDSKMNELLESAGNRHKKFRQKYAHPGPDKDHLFSQFMTDQNSNEVEVLRSSRPGHEPEVHYGTIISGNRLIKTATKRREVVAVVGGSPICLEMEAAGLMNSFPCLVIRGISDYADAHKNDEWQRYAAATASAFAKELLTFVPKTDVARSKDMRTHIMQSGIDWIERVVQANDQKASTEKLTKFLQSIYPYSYEERKNRNPPRVTGTCDWFVSHPTFQTWLQQDLNQAVCLLQDTESDSDQSSLQTEDRRPVLWVSADPGCGKSVLARYLIDQVLPASHRNVYYFFFKDDFPDQGTSINAVKALLHQLVSPYDNLLSNLINQKIDTLGDKMTDSFFTMWKIFLDCVDKLDQEVICVLDGLDECQTSDRFELLNEIRDAAARTSKLKFLLATRPYDDIRKVIVDTGSKCHTLHLSGDSDKEREMISKEIDLVVAYRVDMIYKTRNLDKEERSFLLNQLGVVSHRTYLWAHLTLNIIEESLGFTKGNARAVCAEISPGVEAVYEKILNRSIDKAKTLKILLLIIGAKRPLEVGEMQILLALDENKTKHSELAEFLEPEHRFRCTLRNLCGFFVVIVNSKVYLLHQTAREFLLSRGQERSKDVVSTLKQLEVAYNQFPSPSWGHSISPQITHVAMVIASRRFLSLDGLESGSLASYHLGLYCKHNWLKHLEYGDIDYTDTLLDWIDVANARTSAWYRLIRYPTRSFDPQIESAADYQMQVGAFAGITCLVKRALLITYPAIPSDTQLSLAIKFAVRLQTTEVLEILLAFAAGITLEQHDLERIRQKMLSTLMSLSSAKLVQDIRAGSLIPRKLRDILMQSQTLLQAIKENNRATLQLLLACGANVRVVDEKGRTPLHFAGDPFTVKMLLDAGADPDVYDIWELKPLVYHFQRSHTVQQCKAMQDLLWTGHTNDLLRYYILPYEGFHCRGLTSPLHIITRADATTCSQCISFILSHYDSVDEVTREEQSLWDYARAIGATTETAARPAGTDYSRGDQLLRHNSPFYGHGPWKWDDDSAIMSIPSACTTCGTSTKFEHDRKGIPRTRPAELLSAIVCRRSMTYLIRLIKNRADMNATDAHGRTLLHGAIMYDCGKDIVRLLIEHGVDINKVDKSDHTACYYAIRYAHDLDIIKLLIENGANINKSALIDAIITRSTPGIIKFFINSGIDINHADDEGTPIFHAVKCCCGLSVIRLLIENGADVRTICNKNQTPLICVVSAYYIDNLLFVRYPRLRIGGPSKTEVASEEEVSPEEENTSWKEVLKLVIENGADINAVDSRHRTILHYAIDCGLRIDLITFLLDNAVDVTIADSDGISALMLALQKRLSIEHIKLLVDNGADVDSVNASGETVMHCAILARSDQEVLSLLLEHGADVNDFDSGRESTLQLAARSSLSYQCIHLLLRYLDKACIHQIEGLFTLHGVTKTADVDALVTTGVAVDARMSEADYTPLHAACMHQPFRHHSLRLVECLLGHGADPRIAANNDLSALAYVQRRLGTMSHSDTSATKDPLAQATKAEQDLLRHCLDLLERRSNDLNLEDRYKALFSALENPDQLDGPLNTATRDRSTTHEAWDLSSDLSFPTEDEFSEGDDVDVDSDEVAED